MLAITILMLMKMYPSHHISSIPPGSACRAVCLLSSSLVQVTVERGTSILVTKQPCQPIDRPNAKSRSPNGRKIGIKTAAPARELKVSRVTCKVGGGSWRHPAHSPPHLRYCILSTLTPPISLLLFMSTGPLKFWIWILSMICLSRGSLNAPVTLML